ncbi:transglutaminase domain-containing protein [Thermosynechococcus sp. TG252]|uniref:transglutaminase domain-containing protein n=1 Tax=Thermosynechococcus sp. TG252 TaxID=3074097 RepID=UPI00286107A8|nr:transglutaminase domain-containing protein [Thermosynechococcus sp. TG252]MDR7992045.1 transglutaminase domain-containing protein [Thermosynechococcus sp. TG252]
MPDTPQEVYGDPLSSRALDHDWRTIYPLGAYQIHGLAWVDPQALWLRQLPRLPFCQATLGASFLALDRVRGFILLINGENDHSEILNPYDLEPFLDADGLCLHRETLWFCRDTWLYRCHLPDWHVEKVLACRYPIYGVAVDDTGIYVACQKSGYIHCFDETGREQYRLSAPGIGCENLALKDGYLWVSDRLEQSIYCLDHQSGRVEWVALTPFAQPTAFTFDATGRLWVAYGGEEPYLRDNPNNREAPLEIDHRDICLIHPLLYQTHKEQHYTVSNGYLIEMAYVEEMSPLDALHLDNLEWRIALPANSLRQKLLRVEPVGTPFHLETVGDQQVAVFDFPEVRPYEARLFGWRAWLEVRGIKYHLSFDDIDETLPLPPEFAAQYLVDNDELAMDQPIVQEAARQAVGTETNILRKMLKIRNYVYDRLSYAMRPTIETPDLVLKRGTGSCGEYVGVLLALARLNGIACRTVGRYKCPPHPQKRGIPLQPTYNHVWLEFYVPGVGWLPMESNPDDVVERGPYPTRFFMALPWYHVEAGKGIRFESMNYRDRGLRLGDLALNHVRFTIHSELPPIA